MTSILGRMVTYTGKEMTWDDAINADHQLADVDSYHSYSDTAPVQPNADMSYDVPMPGTYTI